MTVSQRIEAVRALFVVQQHVLQMLAEDLEREGVAVPVVGPTRQLISQADLAFEKAIRENAKAAAERFVDVLPAYQNQEGQ